MRPKRLKIVKGTMEQICCNWFFIYFKSIFKQIHNFVPFLMSW